MPRLSPLILALALAAFAAPPALAEPMRFDRTAIVDREGYGQAIDAYALLVPKAWRTSGRIAWRKPCSGDELFDVLFRTQSRDGRRGFQIQPSLQFLHLELDMQPVPGAAELGLPAVDQIAEAEHQQYMAQLSERFRGTNCHLGRPQSAREIVERHVLPLRPRGARIVAETRVEGLHEQLQKLVESLGAGTVAIPGVQSGYGAEAMEFMLRYDTALGPVEEIVALGVVVMAYRNQGTGMTTVQQITTTLPLYTSWYPPEEADETGGVIGTMLRSMRINPRWNRANAQVRANIQRIRQKGLEERQRLWRQTQAEISQMQMETWQTQQAASDASHAEFLEYIRDVETLTDPTSGAEVEMPAHHDTYWTDGEGGYVGLPAGIDPAHLYPDSVWQEMEPTRR